MSFFDDALQEVCGVMDHAAQKTCEALENSKGHMERLRLRGALNDKYRELGKAQFLHTLGESDESEQIDTLIAELTELREAYVDICRMLNRGGGSTCEKCGKHNVQGNVYCSDCGAPMPREDA